MNEREEKFFSIIKSRSDENEKAINLLLNERCYALIGAILRMELDSLIRVCYFNSVDVDKQEKLLDNFFDSKKWGKSDREMVRQISEKLGWASHIYDFCCAFIHLSPYHDWASSSEIPNLTKERRSEIVKGIKAQQNKDWGYDPTLEIDENFTFDDLILFTPHIFKKLRENLLCEMK